MHSTNKDSEKEVDESQIDDSMIPLEDWISNKSTLKFMKKHFRSNEKIIYIDEFVELIYQEFKKLFSGLHFTDIEFVK